MIKVNNIRCHVGAQIGAQVFTSLDRKSMGFDLTLIDKFGGGVLAYKPGDARVGAIAVFIPCGTIASISFEKANMDAFMDGSEQVEEKKKPGPKPKIA